MVTADMGMSTANHRAQNPVTGRFFHAPTALRLTQPASPPLSDGTQPRTCALQLVKSFKWVPSC